MADCFELGGDGGGGWGHFRHGPRSLGQSERGGRWIHAQSRMSHQTADVTIQQIEGRFGAPISRLAYSAHEA
jgi:hypothetical protein